MQALLFRLVVLLLRATPSKSLTQFARGMSLRLEIRTQKSFLPGVQWPSEYSISAEPPLDVKTCSNSPLIRFIVRYAQYFESPTVRLHSPITSCSLSEPT